jgi:hypothetical protein
VAWGPNTVVKLVVIPATLTQEQARIAQLEALVAKLTELVAISSQCHLKDLTQREIGGTVCTCCTD